MRTPAKLIALCVLAICLTGAAAQDDVAALRARVATLEQQLAEALARIAALEGRPRLLFFTADWCGPCRSAHERLLPWLRRRAVVREIDVDEQPELRRRYGVQSVPTFIILPQQGGERRVIGYDGRTQSQLRQALEGD